MSTSDLNALVDRFCGADDRERQIIVADLLAETSADPANMNLLTMAMHLRGRGQMPWAEALFTMAAAIPRQRPTAMYEMGVMYALQNRLGRAVEQFAAIKATTQLSPAQNFFVARQYARTGEFGIARALIEDCVIADKKLYHDAVAELQFFKYLERYPAQLAFASHLDEQARHRMLDLPGLAASITQALATRTPFSMIRLGDGEGIYLQISVEDESEFLTLYERGRSEFHHIWYSGTELLRNPDFMAEIFRVQAAYENADCLSLINSIGLHHEYDIHGSPRGIPALNNMTRFLRKLRKGETSERCVCQANVHRDLLLTGELDKLLRGRRFIGLVSCYEALPKLMRAAFEVDDIELIQTGGEHVSRLSIGDSGESIRRGERFLQNHLDVCRKFGAIRAGELYLIAAGIFGKIYCDIIKRQGGIAVDIGSVADIWMNVATRTFNAEEKRHALVNRAT